MNHRQIHSGTRSASSDQIRRSTSKRVFLGFLLALGTSYSGILAYHFTVPRPAESATTESWLERCRELCLNYGLIPTGHVANDAQAYLEAVATQNSESDLVLAGRDDAFVPVESEPHPLVGQPAPDFTLPNDRGEPVSLHELASQGPVVVVFYYGYGCGHCVAQLFALHQRRKQFEQLDAHLVAISADSSERTATQFKKYGRFDFPVLSDEHLKVSEQYGVYTPPTDKQKEDLLHGTFLIDRQGTVVFANRGYQPFLDNKSLLALLRRMPRRDVSISAHAPP